MPSGQWPRHLAGIVNALRPTYAVMRPRELGDLQQTYPAVVAAYRVIDRIQVDKSAVDLSFMGMSYYVSDNDFTILRRVEE